MRGKYYQRLARAGPIIREHKECSQLMLASSLQNIGIPTTPWTIDKMKNDILEMYPDIEYNPMLKVFYVRPSETEEEISLSRNSRER